MIRAALYLTRRSFANGMRRRIAQLREPRYVIGLAIGLLYFYWIFARPPGGRLDGQAIAGGIDRAALQLILAWALLVFVALNWVFGESRTPLPFTPAETQFLFTAPLTRRQVIAFKLLRLQLPLLLSATISVLLFSRGHITPMRGVQALGAWLVFTTLSLHFAAASFVRANLAEHGLTGVRRQLVVLGVVAAAVTVSAWTLWPVIPELGAAAAAGVDELVRAIGRVSEGGALAVLLFPFRLIVGPATARTPGDFVVALPGALALLAAHYLWVVHSAIHFEETAVDDAQRRARRIAAAQRGRGELRIKGRLRRPLYRLRATGPAAEAFLWKSLLSVTRQIGSRLLILLALGTGVIALVGTRIAAGVALMAIAGIAVIFGPRVLRQDLREDLLLIDVLKSYPVRGRDIVVGEVLGPTVALTAAGLIAAGAGFVLFAPFAAAQGALNDAAALLAAAVLLIPGIVFVQVTTQNALAVFFPAWTALGAQVSAGLERLGQQIIVMIGSLIVLLLALIPAGLVAGVVSVVLQMVSPVAATIAAAGTGSAVLICEAYLGTFWIGGRLERTDPAEVPGQD